MESVDGRCPLLGSGSSRTWQVAGSLVVQQINALQIRSVLVIINYSVKALRRVGASKKGGAERRRPILFHLEVGANFLFTGGVPRMIVSSLVIGGAQTAKRVNILPVISELDYFSLVSQSNQLSQSVEAVQSVSQSSPCSRSISQSIS